MICCFIFSSAFIIVSFYVSSMPLCFSFIGLSCFPHWEELRKDSTHSSAGRHSHSHRRISQNRVRLSQPQRTALSESLLPSLMDRDRHSWILLPSGWLNRPTWEWVVYLGCVALWLVQSVWVRYGFFGIFFPSSSFFFSSSPPPFPPPFSPFLCDRILEKLAIVLRFEFLFIMYPNVIPN